MQFVDCQGLKQLSAVNEESNVFSYCKFESLVFHCMMIHLLAVCQPCVIFSHYHFRGLYYQ